MWAEQEPELESAPEVFLVKTFLPFMAAGLERKHIRSIIQLFRNQLKTVARTVQIKNKN